MNTQAIDHAALAPAYAVVAAAVLVLLVDLARPGLRAALLGVAALGPAAAGVLAVVVSRDEPRGTLCTPGGTLPGSVDVGPSCSFVFDQASAVAVVVFCALTLVVLGLSAASVSSGDVPAGEYAFLLICSLFGGVVLASARDLLTLIVALETLTLPVYVLVGLRRRSLRSAEGAITFFVVSVVSTSVTLLGAGLLYALTGAVHLDRLSAALGRDELRDLPLTAAAVALVLVGLAFKVAAVPFHAWAPGTYDGAPLPIATYLSTASKVGGVVALLLVVVGGLRPYLDVAGPLLAGVAVATMTVGNLVALRQRRMVRLLAWSSVAQAGYILAPLGAFATAAGRGDDAVRAAVIGVVGYTLFYVLINVGAFGAIVVARGATDGGDIADYQGLARRSPWLGGALALALAGLAGLPPGLAGLFAKVTVVRALLDGSSGWLAVIVGINAVIGLAYYARIAALLFTPPAQSVPEPPSPPARVASVTLAVVTVAAIVVGFAPQWILDASRLFADLWT